MCDMSYVYKHEIIVFNRAGNIRKQYFKQCNFKTKKKYLFRIIINYLQSN